MSSHGGEHIASDSTNEYVVENSSGTDDESILFITTPARRAGYERDRARAQESVTYKSQQQPEGGFDAYSGQLNHNSPMFPNAGFVPRGLYHPFHPVRSTDNLRIITPRELANLPVNDVAWTKSNGQIIEINDELFSKICPADLNDRHCEWDYLTARRPGCEMMRLCHQVEKFNRRWECPGIDNCRFIHNIEHSCRFLACQHQDPGWPYAIRRRCRMSLDKFGMCSAGHDFESARQAAYSRVDVHNSAARNRRFQGPPQQHNMSGGFGRGSSVTTSTPGPYGGPHLPPFPAVNPSGHSQVRPSGHRQLAGPQSSFVQSSPTNVQPSIGFGPQGGTPGQYGSMGNTGYYSNIHHVSPDVRYEPGAINRPHDQSNLFQHNYTGAGQAGPEVYDSTYSQMQTSSNIVQPGINSPRTAMTGFGSGSAYDRPQGIMPFEGSALAGPLSSSPRGNPPLSGYGSHGYQALSQESAQAGQGGHPFAQDPSHTGRAFAYTHDPWHAAEGSPDPSENYPAVGQSHQGPSQVYGSFDYQYQPASQTQQTGSSHLHQDPSQGSPPQSRSPVIVGRGEPGVEQIFWSTSRFPPQ